MAINRTDETEVRGGRTCPCFHVFLRSDGHLKAIAPDPAALSDLALSRPPSCGNIPEFMSIGRTDRNQGFGVTWSVGLTVSQARTVQRPHTSVPIKWTDQALVQPVITSRDKHNQ
ncbi:hypothetical protein RRG08_053597 [Elysia crispata]|uniref:Uncharacterized protein n=1 Tax=Elysia crispata TaxID=231223 RepID=A0AAE0Y2A1_9GAST|nr:hypothetical protein RRG08_053597 [Elysia crispata]